MGARLYLHEYIDIEGEGAVPYMEHTVAFDCERAAGSGLRLFGTWYVVGATGRWPQVVNVWEMVDGWEGWRRLLERTNVGRQRNQVLAAWWKEALKTRRGGFDRLLAAAPGSPSLDELVAAGVAGSLFVHELTSVRPGTAPDYLAALRAEWEPVAADHGHRLVGLYEVLLGDTEVVTLWATDPQGHVALARAAAERTDPRVVSWRAHAREFTTRWREELMVPHAGTPLAGTTGAGR